MLPVGLTTTDIRLITNQSIPENPTIIISSWFYFWDYFSNFPFYSITAAKKYNIKNLGGIAENVSLTSVSGQNVGQEKSTIWFSAATGEDLRDQVIRTFMIPTGACTDRYLGAPVSTSRSSYDFLIGKVASRMATWRG